MIKLDNVSYVIQSDDGADATVLLENVSCEIPTGQRFGLLGAAGSGKTTLIRLLAGLEQPTSGTIERFAHLSFPIGYEGIFKRHLSVTENLEQFRNVFGPEISSVIEFVKLVTELGTEADKPLGGLAPEMQRRFVLAAGYALPFECYLVDERFACGPADAVFREKCIVMLEARGAQNGLILATSRKSIIQRFCNTAALLHKGRIYKYARIDEVIAAHASVSETRG